jgi:hypothetical protein
MSPECDGERPCIRLGTVDLIAAVSALVPKSCNRQSPRHRDAKGCAVSSGNAQSLREPVVRSLSAGYLAGAAMICLGLSAAQAADKVTTFDVAEDHTRFHFDERPVFEDGMPKAGNPFVTQGYIYPAGMLDGKDGVLEKAPPPSPTRFWARGPATVGSLLRARTRKKALGSSAGRSITSRTAARSSSARARNTWTWERPIRVRSPVGPVPTRRTT